MKYVRSLCRFSFLGSLSLLATAPLGACGSDPTASEDGDDAAGGETSSPTGGGQGGRAGNDGPGNAGRSGAEGGASPPGSEGGAGSSTGGGGGGSTTGGGGMGSGGAPGGGPGGAGSASGQGGEASAPKPIFAQPFDTLATDSPWLSSCKWKKHTRVTEACGVAGTKCLRIAQDPINKEPSLFPLPPLDDRPPYPSGSNGVCEPYYTNTATDVVQAVQPIDPQVEVTLAYDIFFEEGFDWARGGKLPGLSAKEWDSGCSVEGDGLSTDPGPARWSVRLMWRAAGTNELYVYDQDRAPGACGTRAPSPMPFSTGKWHAVSVYVKLNTTADSRDGIARMYIDGALMRNEEGLRLRGTDSKASKITNIFFSTFYGGNEAKRLHCLTHPDDRYCKPADPNVQTTWAPQRTGFIRFDNVAVYPGLWVRRSPGL